MSKEVRRQYLEKIRERYEKSSEATGSLGLIDGVEPKLSIAS